MLSVVVKGAERVLKDLEKDRKETEKALHTAIRVEGFSLMKQLKSEIRAGAPGRRRFRPLTYLGRYGGKKRKNNPLARLALPIRYHIDKKDPFVIKIGWTGPQVSKSWKRLAALLQKGFSRRISEKQRRWFRRALKKEVTRVPKSAKRYFKLRKETTEFDTPARPILDPFWTANRNIAWRRIRRNFLRKLAGERI